MPYGIPLSDKHTGLTFEGKEILLIGHRGHPRQGLIEKRMKEAGEFEPAKQFEATTLYAATGSFALASEKSGVPEKVIRKWAREPWFRDILFEFRMENLAKLDAAFTEIIDKAALELKDRLENGDWVVTKFGKQVRKPVGIRDLALVQAINIDKRQLIRGEPTSRTEQVDRKEVEVLLENLGNKFKEMIDFKKAPQLLDIEDAEIIEETDLHAKQVQETSSPDGGSSPQQVLRKEGGD